MRAWLIPLVVLALALPAQAQDSVVVFMYHRFGDDRHPSTNIRMDQLREQFEALRDGGYTVMPLSDALAALEGGEALPERAVVLTVDDAYRSVYEEGWPVFREFGYPFTVFVATGTVDGGRPDYMSWEQMREMGQAGVTFANHGVLHLHYPNVSGDRAGSLAADMDDAESRLAEQLGKAHGWLPGVFAWPYGEYDALSLELAEQRGWVAFGQQSGPVGRHSDRQAMPRFPMSEAYAQLDAFLDKASSLPFPLSHEAPRDPVTANPRPDLTLGFERLPGAVTCFVAGQGVVRPEWSDDRSRFVVTPARDLPAGRNRVNCTAPAGGGRFHWYSRQWVVRPDNRP